MQPILTASLRSLGGLFSAYLLLSCHALAATTTPDDEVSPYWQEFDSDWVIGLATAMPSYDLTLMSADAESTVDYEPNINFVTSLSIAYRGLQVSIGVDAIEADESEVYGSSEHQDYQVRLYRNHFNYEFFYQAYQGFYTERSGHTPYLRPDIQTQRIGLNVIYLHRPERYSMSAAFGQTQQQLRSGGSWAVYGSLNQQKISADESLVPSFLRGTDSGVAVMEPFSGGTFLTGGLGGGYGHTLSWGHFYISAMGLLGLELQRLDTQWGDESQQSWELGDSFLFKTSLGYSGSRHGLGMDLHMDTFGINLTEGEAELHSFGGGIFYRVRF